MPSRPQEALELLREHAPGKAQRSAELRRIGLPTYTSSAGWLGYSEEKVRALCGQYRAGGWRAFKMKVGSDDAQNVRRAAVMREALGADCHLMFDANQVWDVPEAIAHMAPLAQFDPLWIEEPTFPDDAMGHGAIARAIAPIGVATGEHCPNRVVFKQLMQAGGMDYCQVDACRLGGVNEVLAVLLLAAKFGIPVCPHAGGVGLVRVRAAPVGFPLRGGGAEPGGRADRVLRPPARALRRPGGDPRRALRPAGGARLQHHHAAGLTRPLRVPARRGLERPLMLPRYAVGYAALGGCHIEFLTSPSCPNSLCQDGWGADTGKCRRFALCSPRGLRELYSSEAEGSEFRNSDALLLRGYPQKDTIRAV